MKEVNTVGPAIITAEAAIITADNGNQFSLPTTSKITKKRNERSQYGWSCYNYCRLNHSCPAFPITLHRRYLNLNASFTYYLIPEEFIQAKWWVECKSRSKITDDGVEHKIWVRGAFT